MKQFLLETITHLLEGLNNNELSELERILLKARLAERFLSPAQLQKRKAERPVNLRTAAGYLTSFADHETKLIDEEKKV